jgi:hypothetical protein
MSTNLETFVESVQFPGDCRATDAQVRKCKYESE